MTYWAENINVGEDTVLDDYMVEAFNNWLGHVDIDTIIILGDIYGVECKREQLKEFRNKVI